MGEIFCVKSQRVLFEISHKISYPYIEKYDFKHHCKFKSSQIYELVCVFETPPPPPQLFSIMIFVPVVEHAPTLTVCLSLTNFKGPISQKDLWNFWFDKSLWKLSRVLHKIHTWNCELRCFISYYPSLVSKCRKYSAYMVKFMNDCLMENHGFEIHLMTFCERTTQQLIELDTFTVVIKRDTVETNINMFNNVIWPLTQNILKISGIMSLKFGTPHCLQGTPFLGTHGVPGTPKC